MCIRDRHYGTIKKGILTIGQKVKTNVSSSNRAKAASSNIDLTLEGSLEREIDVFNKTVFNGYKSLLSEAEIKGIFLDSRLVKEASEGQKVLIVLDQTTFYGESGGQVGDIGTISVSYTHLRAHET